MNERANEETQASLRATAQNGELLDILIWSTPHEYQRYNTCGDYYNLDEVQVIKISNLPDRREMLLIAIHELIEMALCEVAGISNEEIDAFDLAWDSDGEPGDSAAAPYYRQHQIATGIERILATEMHVNWNTYEQHIQELSPHSESNSKSDENLFDSDIPF